MAAKQDILTKTADILVVDDSIASLRMLAEILVKEGYEIRPVEDPELALEAAFAQPPSLILLDVKMPKMSGFELCRRLKLDERTRDVPVIFVSALDELQDRIQGFEVGGVDFISKPIQELEVVARVNTHMQLRKTQLHLEELVAERTNELEKLLQERAQALDSAEAQIRLLFSNSPIGIAVTTLESEILTVNRALLDMLRISEEELTQRSVRDFYVEAADREALLSAVQQSGYVRDYGIQLLRHDGSNFYASLNMSQLVLEGNEVLLTMVEDVTDKILAETALRENEQRFKALFESLPLPSYYWQRRGEDFVLIKCNNAADEFTDGGTRKLIGWTATKMYPDRPDIREDFYRCYIEKVTIHREMEYTTRSSGEDQVLSVTYAFSPPDLVIVQTQDISDRKKLEFQLAEAAARAERERLARELHDAVTQTLFTASILAQTTPRLLEKNPAVASQNMKQLDELLRGALAEMRILLLELRPTKFGEKNLAQLFDLLTESTRARTGVNIIMNVDSNCSPPQDVAIAFYRITQESLNNVAKYALASEVVVDLSCDTSGMLLSIKDDGRGFDPSAIPAGHMGVSIMRARAQEIGASLKIDSEIGRGTQVTVSWSAAGKKSALGDESEHE